MATLISVTILVLLLEVPISRQLNVTEGDLLPSDAVCSHLCQTHEPTTEVYLTNGQKKHLEDCQDFILALEETPRMLEIYSDLQGMEMVHFTGAQSKKLITGYNGYYRQKSELPSIDTGQEIQLELPTYDNETLQNVQQEFLNRWNAYTELEQSLQGIDIHWDDSKSTEEEQEQSDQKKDNSKDTTSRDEESTRILSRKKRLGKSYRPPKTLRELIRERISLGLDLSLKSNNVFNPRLHTSKREGLPKIEVNNSALPEEGLSESSKQRFMRRYHEAIEKSLIKIRTGTRVGGNSIRQKRQTKEETFVELCPTVKFWTAMVLGYDDAGNLVQITQVLSTT